VISSDGYPRITLAFTDPDLPTVVPYGYAKYTDFKEMARGGRAILWSCWDSIMGRPVALKALLPQFAQDEKERRRFLREARVTAQLQHPHTVPVYEIGRDDQGCLYFTMKMIRGEDTFKILRRLAAGDRETRLHPGPPPRHCDSGRPGPGVLARARRYSPRRQAREYLGR